MSKRVERAWLVAIILVGLAIRLAIVLRANAHLPDDASRLGGDEPEYHYLARRLLDGKWFDYPLRLPVYPAFMALVLGATGRSLDALFVVQGILGVTSILLTWMLGRRLAGARAGLVAAAIVACHNALVTDATRALTENLYTPALLGFLLVFHWALRSPTWQRFALAGVALGLVNLIRPSALALPLALALGLVLTMPDRRRALVLSAALIAASIATIAPWTVNNAVVYHTFLPLSTSNGQLWQGSPEYYELRQSGRSYLSIWENELNGAVNGGHYPASIEGDRWFTRRAIDSIEHDPLTYARYSAEKVAWFWIGHPSADWFDGTIFGFGNLHRYWPTWEVVWMLASRLLPLVALAALIIERRRLRRLWPLVAVLAYFTVVHALTWAELRLSDPMVPLLAVVIGVAFTSLRPGGDVATDAAFHPRAGSGSRSRSPVLEGSSETEVAYPASSGSVSTGVSAPVRRSV